MSNKNDYKQEKVYQENLKAIETYKLAEIRCNKIMVGFVLLSLIGIGTSIPFIVKSGDIIHEYQNNDNEYASIIDEQTEGVHQKYLNGEIDEITLENELDKINSFDNAKAILKDSSCPLKFQYSNNQNVTFFYRIFKADGSLSSGSSSPKGFTTNSSVTIKPGLNKVALAGWGNSKGTVYKAGIHTFELWLDGEKIYETTFNVGEKETDSYLTVDSKTRVSTTFSLNGGTETFYVKTVAGSWEIYDVPSWCNVTKKTETSFTLSCEPNKTGAARTGCIKVKAGDKEVRIDIEQTTYVGSDLFFT